MLSDPQTPNAPGGRAKCLNAPYGARRFLTVGVGEVRPRDLAGVRNAAYGAGCFLTVDGHRKPAWRVHS